MSTARDYRIREILPPEYEAVGKLTVSVYQQLEGMPGPDLMPDYYQTLLDVETRLQAPSVQILVAIADGENPALEPLMGAVTFVGEMQDYGAESSATQLVNTGGIRLLAVDPAARGSGVGRALTEACIDRSRDLGHSQVALHTTSTMKIAWGLYERMGFQRSTDLDFDQGPLPVFGFRLALD
jgi:ribosomal protein S18 acetylase RimI-like enzyme